MANHLRNRAKELEVPTTLSGILGGALITSMDSSLAAIEELGLDWGVQKTQIALRDKHHTRYQGVWGIYRSAGPGTNIPLGLSRGRYKPVPNKAAFGWVDRLCDMFPPLEIVTGGMFYQGTKVWLAVSLQRTPGVIDHCAVISNSHDADSPWLVHYMPVDRVRGTIITTHSAAGAFRMDRDWGMSGVPDEAVNRIACWLKEARDQFEEVRRDLASKQLSSEDFDRFTVCGLGSSASNGMDWFNGKLNKQPQWVKQYEAVKQLYGSGSTSWELYTALTAYYDHVRTVRGSGSKPELLVENRMFGYSAKQKSKLFELFAGAPLTRPL